MKKTSLKTQARFDLSQRVVLLTGAAGHLGHALACGLAAAGAQVVLNGRNAAPLKATAAAIRRDGGFAKVLAFDVTDAAAVAAALKKLTRQFGRLDILINNAYAGRGGTLALSTDADFESSYAVCVVSAARLIRQALPLLEAAGQQNPAGASVINMASMYGVVSPDFRVYATPEENNPPFYGAAKAALVQLSRYLACQLAPRHIRVNAISPGPFPAPQVQAGQPDFCARLAGKVPLGRIGAPDDLVGPVLFLASDAAAYVTGTNLIVDGGWTAW